MNKIIISTESCSDLTESLCKKHGIYVVPMHIIFDDYCYNDGEIPVQMVYDYYEKTKKVPKTSAVNPNEFTDFFEHISKENDNAPIIHIGYSSLASCTFQNAAISLEESKRPNVYLVDSKNVSGGAANVTLLAVKLRDENPEISPEELVKRLEVLINKVATVFLPENLDYLMAGGRVSNAAALCANMLRIKPRIDIVEGRLIAGRKYRGTMGRAAAKLTKDFLSENDFVLDRAFVLHAPGNDKKIVEHIADLLKTHGFKEIITVTTGCIMTTHGGPGAIGISALRK